MLCDDLIEHLAISQDLIRLDLNVADLATDATVRLVQHYASMWQREPLSGGAAGQQHGSATRGLSHTVGGHGAAQNLHGVVDCHRRHDISAGRVDIEVDVFAAIFALQIQQLHDDIIRIAGENLSLKKHNAVLQQEIAQRQLALPLVRLIRMRILDGFRKRSAHAI
jgi:hypothetical protein